MLCVWWDMEGIIHYELLPENQTITKELYCELSWLKQAIDEKRPALPNRKGVLFHNDNARPRMVQTTQEKIRQFEWEIMAHPPYSPDLVPSDYHPFRSLQSHLNGKFFNSEYNVRKELDLFFRLKQKSFYR